MSPIENPAVAEVFDGYPPWIRRRLLALRRLILDAAASTDGVGRIEETLKWGEPAYLTPETRSGSTIRLGWKASAPTEYSLNVHCQTSLIADFREWFPDVFTFDGNRRLVFDQNDPIPEGPLTTCIAAALTYHRDRKRRR